MHTIDIKEIDKRFYIPENLSECSRKQYLDMSKLILMYQTGEVSYDMFRVLGLYNLMNMDFSPNDLEHIEEEKIQNVYITSRILDSFFSEDEKGVKHLIQDYIHNPIKSVKYKFLTFHGPKDAFKNITWKQLVEGLGEVQDFAVDGNIERLVKLFATFYLRKGERLKSIDLDKRIRFFNDLDIRYIYGFYLLFVSFWKFLTSSSIVQIDGKEIDLTLLFTQSETETKVEYTQLGLRSTAFQIAESGVFGSMNELNETNAWDILIRMYDMMVRNAIRKEEMENAGK